MLKITNTIVDVKIPKMLNKGKEKQGSWRNLEGASHNNFLKPNNNFRPKNGPPLGQNTQTNTELRIRDALLKTEKVDIHGLDREDTWVERSQRSNLCQIEKNKKTIIEHQRWPQALPV